MQSKMTARNTRHYRDAGALAGNCEIARHETHRHNRVGMILLDIFLTLLLHVSCSRGFQVARWVRETYCKCHFIFSFSCNFQTALFFENVCLWWKCLGKPNHPFPFNSRNDGSESLGHRPTGSVEHEEERAEWYCKRFRLLTIIVEMFELTERS